MLVPFAEIMPCFIFKGQDIQSRIRELGGDKEIVKQEITGERSVSVADEIRKIANLRTEASAPDLPGRVQNEEFVLMK